MLRKNFPSKAGVRSKWRALFAVVFLLFAGLVGEVVDASFFGAIAADRETAFDVPAQPLEDAIQAFMEASGVQILYETTLTLGRRSTAIKGQFTAESALHSLLRGTSLQARKTTAGAFTIFSQDNPQTIPTATAGMARRHIDMRKDGEFLGEAQAGIVAALCRSALTRPGRYWMKLRIRIDVSGMITEVAVTKSTGEGGRDAAIANSLLGLTFRTPAPPDLPQPLGIIIVPRNPKETGDCSVADSQ